MAAENQIKLLKNSNLTGGGSLPETLDKLLDRIIIQQGPYVPTKQKVTFGPTDIYKELTAGSTTSEQFPANTKMWTEIFGTTYSNAVEAILSSNGGSGGIVVGKLSTGDSFGSVLIADTVLYDPANPPGNDYVITRDGHFINMVEVRDASTNSPLLVAKDDVTPNLTADRRIYGLFVGSDNSSFDINAPDVLGALPSNLALALVYINDDDEVVTIPGLPQSTEIEFTVRRINRIRYTPDAVVRGNTIELETIGAGSNAIPAAIKERVYQVVNSGGLAPDTAIDLSSSSSVTSIGNGETETPFLGSTTSEFSTDANIRVIRNGEDVSKSPGSTYGSGGTAPGTVFDCRIGSSSSTILFRTALLENEIIRVVFPSQI